MRRLVGSAVAAFLLTLACVPAHSSTSETPRVRSRIEPAEVVVGQEQRLVVDVLVPTWLLGAPRLPEISIAGVIVAPSGESGVNLTETIDGETWSGVSNEYSLFTQRPGRFETPADPVSIEYSVDGGPETVRVPIPSQSFSARLAPGVSRGEHVLASSSLELSEEIEPAPEDLRVGDSVRRTLRIEAEDTRAMLLPDLAPQPIAGLAAYPDTPRLVDRPGQRGGPPVAERVESTSFILEQPGHYELPAVEIRWWNVSAARLEVARAPGVSFDVAPNPQIAAGARRGRSVSTRWWVLGGSLLVLLAAAYRRRDALSAVGDRVVAWLERMRHSERSYFGAFVRATRSGDPRAVLRSLFAWLDRRAGSDRTATVTAFVAESDGEELGREADALQAALYADRPEGEPAGWSAGEIRRAAVEARARAGADEAPEGLPKLNL